MSEPITYFEFHDAFIGMAERCGSGLVAIYDMRKMIDICITRGNMSAQDAEEYIEYNYMNAYLGESTPYIITVHADEIADIA